MTTPLVSRGGRVVVWWRALREVEPLLKGYVRLARAETALATASIKGLVICFAAALLGTVLFLMAAVAALMMLLRDNGLPLWAAFAWVAIPSVLLAIFGFVTSAASAEQCSLPQTRKRVRVLMELIDEER
ncbi:MAG: phage holin family protein [Rudaea sp.]